MFSRTRAFMAATLWQCGRGAGVGPARGRRSVLAPDVELVRLVDEVGATLAVSDEPAEERRTQVADPVDVRDDFHRPDSGQEAVELTADQHVLASERGDGSGQPWRGSEDLAVQTVGSLRDVDVLPEVAGELHRGDMDT